MAKVFALFHCQVRELGLVKGKMYELGIGHTSILQWGQYFRDVCYRRDIRDEEKIQLRPVLTDIGGGLVGTKEEVAGGSSFPFEDGIADLITK
ncbi:unnamed protein product [Cylicostephanus goldi]|uniref:Uncharacterized protein n=1 Tax=Cylicostephanus goldi TaxID=71465 RepID=A0A3P6R6W9_CYLGO|nr:unnamed protein product [Cylicostephanus goldi]